MRRFFLAVAAMSGFLPVAWFLGLYHVFDVYEQDYYVAYLWREELREPIPGVFRLLYEFVPGPYAALAAAVSLIALLLARAVSLQPELFAGVTDLLAEAVGSRPQPMGIHGRNSLWARVHRWMRTHRRATFRGETRYSIAKTYCEEKHERLLGQPTSSSSQSLITE